MLKVPAASELVYIGPPPGWDPSSRLAFYGEEEAGQYHHPNANVQFRVRDKSRVASWVERFKQFGLNYINFEGELSAELSSLFPEITFGFSMFGTKSSCKSYDGPPCRLDYIWLDKHPVYFTRVNFPSLRFLSARVDSSGKLCAFIGDNASLKHLGITGYDEEVVNNCGGICSIQIADAKIETVNLMSDNPNITTAWLHNLSGLSTVAFLEKWPSLKHLKIFYCPKVTDFSPLLALQNLEKVELVTNKPPKDLSLLLELRNRGVEMGGGLRLPDNC